MTGDPKEVSKSAPANTAAASGAPAFSADEAQPSAAVHEYEALSEREDGTNRGGPNDAAPNPGPDAVPTIVLTADEEQPVSAVAEHDALSEREDGTNRG